MSILQQQPKGCIVVVAKCPIPGKSKTRLVPLMGQDGSSKLAKAMLSDVLLTLEHCPDLNNVTKVLLYAPGDDSGLSIMKGILKDIGIDEMKHCWKLLPMISPNLQSSDLGGILQHALDRVLDVSLGSHGVVFLGMDSPEIPLQDIVKGLKLASKEVDASSSPPEALLCPCSDGGYGMLCVPSTSVHKGIFDNVYWSHPLTAVSQLKALTDASVPVVIGRLMHDIDEPDDVHKLCQRLLSNVEITAESKVMGLQMYSSYGESINDGNTMKTKVESKHEECMYTRLALEEIGLLAANDKRK